MKSLFLGSSWVLFCAIFGVWVAVMALDNEQPYTYDGPTSRVIPDPVRQNSMVEVDWAIKVNRICPGTVQRFFRNCNDDSPPITTDTTQVSRAVRPNAARIRRAFQLPPNLPAHTCYSALVCSECNWLQQFKPLCFVTPEISFRVVD